MQRSRYSWPQAIAAFWLVVGATATVWAAADGRDSAVRARATSPAANDTLRNQAQNAIPAGQANELKALLERLRALEAEVAALKSELQRTNVEQKRAKALYTAHVHEVAVASYGFSTAAGLKQIPDATVVIWRTDKKHTQQATTTPPQ